MKLSCSRYFDIADYIVVYTPTAISCLKAGWDWSGNEMDWKRERDRWEMFSKSPLDMLLKNYKGDLHLVAFHLCHILSLEAVWTLPDCFTYWC